MLRVRGMSHVENQMADTGNPSRAPLMQNLEEAVAEAAASVLGSTGGAAQDLVSVQRPPRPEMGDAAVGAFRLAAALKQKPPEAAEGLSKALRSTIESRVAEGLLPEIERLVVAGPYVNVFFRPASLIEFVCQDLAAGAPPYGGSLSPTGRRIMVEYSAPNTNKPLHLGHVRNNLLGLSVCNILAAAGNEVIPVNLVNDRGIHIAKSMVAYRRWGGGRTPESEGSKGDHFVGEFYVRFDQEMKKQREAVAAARGIDLSALEERQLHELDEETELMKEAREVLRRWEQGDAEVRALWEQMNSWVYAGFDETYRRLGCRFRKWYLESETYRLGKQVVEEGLSKGVFERHEDGSVWADLEDEGLGKKILLRSDGTSVYITQDLGTALLKFRDFEIDRSIYVVGSEQNLHFKILFALLRRLGYERLADGCYHLSYALVTLPRGMGRLKSREGRKVDADDLLDELAALARKKVEEGGYAERAGVDVDALAEAIGQGALKMMLLQVGAEKTLQFDPEATIDFEGDTGPAVQYSHARIASIVRKALERGLLEESDLITFDPEDPFAGLGTGSPVRAPDHAPWRKHLPEVKPDAPARAWGLRGKMSSRLGEPAERALALEIAWFPQVLRTAAEQLNPAPVANYLLGLTKAFARFYHEHPVLQASDEETRRARLALCLATAGTLRRGLALLGIEAPAAM